jgi:hypothetical protein
VIVVHACWNASGLRLWGETSHGPFPAPRRPGRPPRTPRTRPHPFAASQYELRSAVEGLGATEKAYHGAELTLHLPSYPRGPLPSPFVVRARAGEAEAPEPTGTAPWTTPAVAFRPAEALDFLLALPTPAPQGVVPADTLRALAELAKLALELVARGHVVPGLERQGSGAVAAWRPVLSDEADAARLAAFRRALPGACRADDPAADKDVADGALEALTDACIRQALAGHDLVPPRRGRRTPAENWLKALLSPYGWLAGEPSALEPLHQALAAWRPARGWSAGGWCWPPC